MARSRVIKPEFWGDEKLVRVSLEARLLYIGLWNTCDDTGRSKGHPIWLKSQISPYDNLSPGRIEKWLSDLVNLRRIPPYTVNGEQYYFIPGFLKHQKIQHPSPAGNPAPPPEVREPRNCGGSGPLAEANPPAPPPCADLSTRPSRTAHEQTEAEARRRREGGKYIPYPATWLYAKGWEDETPIPIMEERKRARTLTGPEPLRLIMERHGLDPASGRFPDG